MKKIIIAVVHVMLATAVMAAPVGKKTKTKTKTPSELYKQAGAPIDQRVKDLMARMTLEEKIMQLNQYIIGLNTNGNNFGYKIEKVPGTVGSVINFSESPELRNELQREAMATRLGIPVLFGYDVIHGYRTVFPIPLAVGCSWNPELTEQVYHMAAKETRASGTEWAFAPMVDIARDARWGRVAEGYGEDPYLASLMGMAAVRGYQGENLSDDDRIAACLKHYVGYGCSEGGRDYTATSISDQTMWETYLPPFQNSVAAGARTAMSSFNDINGTPSTANRHYLTEVLKERFGLPGFIVSDWNAVVQLISQGHAETRKDAARLAFNAGLDMDMIDNCYADHLAELIDEGKVSMHDIDASVERILRMKFELGLFEKPFTKEVAESARVLKPEYKALAAKIAEESMVLLKNKASYENDNENNSANSVNSCKNKSKGLLPLCGQQLALIGPMVKDRHEIIGSWRCFGEDKDAQTLYEGMVEEFGENNLLYAKGCDFDGDDTSLFDEAIATAQKAEVVVMMMGEKAAWSGENASRSTLALPSIQENLIKAIAKTGKPIVLVLSAGRPTELCRIEPLCTSILEIWQPGICGGSAMAGILSGRINPSGRLDITFPLDTHQIPIYYNARQSSRVHEGHYQDISSLPLYEFGYGLSYSNYVYGDIKTESYTMHRGETLRLTIDVTNGSDMDGMETVQWYVRDPASSITRPVKELRHFEKRLIRKGETETFVLDIDADKHLSYVDSKGNRFVEDGTYYIIVKDKTIKIELK